MSQPPDGAPADGTATGVPTCYRHPGRETWIRCQRCDKPICPDCMRDAAVGFQCPDCVKEAARTSRQNRAMYGGERSADPRLTSLVLIGINAVVWLAVIATGWKNSDLIARLALVPKGTCESLSSSGYYPTAIGERLCTLGTGGDGHWVPGVADGAVWQLITSQFLHVEIWHIASNMLALWFLGPQLEAVLGRTRFLALYLLSGLAGSVAVLWLSGSGGLTLGASGAIYGLFGAYAVIAHKVRADLRSIATLLAVNLFITFAIPNISWQGHLGGIVGGAVVAAIIAYAPRTRRTLVQALGLGGFLLVLVALIAARIAALS
ncbi:Membrane associated serine protease, rhomboid family [Nocardioides exalbidus]|uniref:Membrane associated serine protease, rhomboid family n=1 Tax=Nocardioides exalbidus TaxID=402596 RepID=A0A1H4NZQ5_9ACTN|nr:rhomboid family intramembrane serine protease [Nocardioides exalbidus]SEC00711.1 Membrane associated serine protease, rhomboid family [Nocardioides exalbidus]